MVMPLLAIPNLLIGGAGLVGGLAMGYWATTNLIQTKQISSDNAKALEQRVLEYLLDVKEYEQQNRYLDLAELQQDWAEERLELEQQFEIDLTAYEYALKSELESQQYNQSIAQTALIGALDQQETLLSAQLQSHLQSQSLSFQSAMWTAKQQQLEADRQTYITEKAFETSQDIDNTFGEPEPMTQVAYILSELQQIESKAKQREYHPSIQEPNFIAESYEDSELFVPSNDLIH